MPVNTSEDLHKRIIVKVMGQNQYIANKPVLSGIHQLELRLLSKMGFEVLVRPTFTAEMSVSTLIMTPDLKSFLETLHGGPIIMKLCKINSSILPKLRALTYIKHEVDQTKGYGDIGV